jgi:hypothetical protein
VSGRFGSGRSVSLSCHTPLFFIFSALPAFVFRVV